MLHAKTQFAEGKRARCRHFRRPKFFFFFFTSFPKICRAFSDHLFIFSNIFGLGIGIEFHNQHTEIPLDCSKRTKNVGGKKTRDTWKRFLCCCWPSSFLLWEWVNYLRVWTALLLQRDSSLLRIEIAFPREPQNWKDSSKKRSIRSYAKWKQMDFNTATFSSMLYFAAR